MLYKRTKQWIQKIREANPVPAVFQSRPVSVCVLIFMACGISLTGCDASTSGRPAGDEIMSEMESGEGLSEGLEESLSMSEAAGMAFDEESISEGNPDQESAPEGGELSGTAWWDEQEERPMPLQIFTDGVHCLIPGWKLVWDVHLPYPVHCLGLLQGKLEQILSGYEGTWSAAVRDLTNGEKIVIHDEPMPSASVMKLFILGCVYEDIRAGRLSRTEELVARMRSMISASSNTDANEIIRILGEGDYAAGVARINRYIRDNGFSESTVIYNPFQEVSLILDHEHSNHTSADDAAEILERIYRRTFATRSACNETEQMLLDSSIRYKIPSVLPEGVVVENKTGETDDIENDAAIICTAAGDYILTVFSTGWPDKGQAQKRIKEISAEVYRYFSDPDYGKKLYPYLDWPEEDQDLQVLREEEDPALEDMTETEPVTEDVTEAVLAEEDVTEAVSANEDVTEAVTAKEDQSEADTAGEGQSEAAMAGEDQPEADAAKAE